MDKLNPKNNGNGISISVDLLFLIILFILAILGNLVEFITR